MLRRIIILLGFALWFDGGAHAAQSWIFGDNTRYLAMGDSLTAGYGAVPATNGYAYQLYQQGVYDTMTNTLFANSAVPGATSEHVLKFQAPQALASLFAPHVITMTVGGNDILPILTGADFLTTLQAFGDNLVGILGQLCTLQDTRIYIGNFYEIRNFPDPRVGQVIGAFNAALNNVVVTMNAGACHGRVRIADVHAVFDRTQQGLLLINRNGAGLFEIHPTNAGYRAIAQAFIAAK